MLATYLAAALLVALLALGGAGVLAPAGSGPAAALANAIALMFHVVMFVVVAALPAREWAVHAGYGWLALGVASSVMLLQGGPEATATPLRLGGQVLAAMWVAAASWVAGGSMRALGFVAALTLAGAPLLAPAGQAGTALLSLLPLAAWLPLAARAISRSITPGT